MKELDFSKSVYELTQQYPELVEIMRDLGFTEIVKPGMLQSVGRVMTIPKGAKMKKIPMMKVVTKLMLSGFTLTGKMPEGVMDKQDAEPLAEPQPLSRTEQLKNYLRRLGEGEDLETIREEFREQFGDVEASEIMCAEQELMREGTPLEEVQRLCDVHSALFHGSTREERIANTEKEVAASLARERQADMLHSMADQNQETAARLVAIEGHPLYTFTKENEALAPLLQQTQEQLAADNLPLGTLAKIREIAIHYAKKGDLLYPLLKTRYDITGPQEVMWTVDDEIRDEMGALLRETNHDAQWIKRAQAVLTRAEEMIYKEANILFPICAANFKNDEWFGIYRDAKDYAVCLGVEKQTWAEAEQWLNDQNGKINEQIVNDKMVNEVVLPSGHLTLDQLTALLNTIPGEITFVDADNINRYFNEGEKVFKRPGMAIDREVFSCHPPKIEPMVRAIIDSFRKGERDMVEVWMEKGGHEMLVRYIAVRAGGTPDPTTGKGRYLGTMEFVQDMQFAKEHFTNK